MGAGGPDRSVLALAVAWQVSLVRCWFCMVGLAWLGSAWLVVVGLFWPGLVCALGLRFALVFSFFSFGLVGWAWLCFAFCDILRFLL